MAEGIWRVLEQIIIAGGKRQRGLHSIHTDPMCQRRVWGSVRFPYPSVPGSRGDKQKGEKWGKERERDWNRWNAVQ